MVKELLEQVDYMQLLASLELRKIAYEKPNKASGNSTILKTINHQDLRLPRTLNIRILQTSSINGNEGSRDDGALFTTD